MARTGPGAIGNLVSACVWELLGQAQAAVLAGADAAPVAQCLARAIAVEVGQHAHATDLGRLTAAMATPARLAGETRAGANLFGVSSWRASLERRESSLLIQSFDRPEGSQSPQSSRPPIPSLDVHSSRSGHGIALDYATALIRGSGRIS